MNKLIFFLFSSAAILGLFYYTYFFEPKETFEIIQMEKVEVRKYDDRIEVRRQSIQVVPIQPQRNDSIEEEKKEKSRFETFAER